MQIDFNTTFDGEMQAKGVVAALVAMFGTSVLPQDDNVIAVVTQTPVPPRATVAYQVTVAEDNEPDAATAFASTSEPDAAKAFASTPEPSAAAAFAPAPAVPAGVELDKRGIPWDERIHSSTKAKTAKDEWQRRRNTPDEVFDRVMGELKARYSGQPTTTPSAPPPPPPPPSASAGTTTAPVPSPTPAAPAASSTVPAGTDEPITFAKIMIKTMQMQQQGKITTDAVNNLLKSCGVADMAGLKDDSIRFAFNSLLDDPANHTGA